MVRGPYTSCLNVLAAAIILAGAVTSEENPYYKGQNSRQNLQFSIE